MDDARLASLLDAAFDFLCEQPLERLIDVPRLVGALDGAAAHPDGERRLAGFVARHLAPLRERLLARARASAVPLGAWLPDEAQAALAELLGRPAPLPRALVEEVAAGGGVRENVRAMLHEAVSGALARGGGSGRGMRGLVGWGARAAGAAGRGLLGGLGDDLQRALEERLREFVDGHIGEVQARMAKKLASDETARLLGRRRRDAFLHLLGRTEADVARQLDRVPFAELEALVPSVLAHNLRRPELRAALRDEAAHALADLAARPLGALLDDLALRARAREALREHGLPLARAFVASPAFAAWAGSR